MNNMAIQRMIIFSNLLAYTHIILETIKLICENLIPIWQEYGVSMY